LTLKEVPLLGSLITLLGLSHNPFIERRRIMNFLKKSCVCSICMLSILMLTGIFLSGEALAANTVILKVYKGYRFSDGAITKSGDKSADVSFYVNMGRRNAYSFALATLGAKKIKEFGKEKPNVKSLSLQLVDSWEHYVNAPSPGYYVVQGANGNSLYLIKVISFKNQGKASSYWELTFSWEEIPSPS
jgi:hypothetical protein